MFRKHWYLLFHILSFQYSVIWLVFSRALPFLLFLEELFRIHIRWEVSFLILCRLVLKITYLVLLDILLFAKLLIKLPWSVYLTPDMQYFLGCFFKLYLALTLLLYSSIFLMFSRWSCMQPQRGCWIPCTTLI